MSTSLAFPYPPAPAVVPGAITQLGTAYRLRSAAMLLSLFLFLLLYIGMIIGVAWLIYLAMHIPLETGRSGRGAVMLVVFKFGLIAAGILLIIFLIKGLFKGQRMPRDQYLPLQKEDSPQLWKFIYQVCKDTGAPKPRRIYLSPDVNAAVIFNSSLLNLVIPPRKDLLIGLGLVNVVTLNEFKAVLAHEFGHFAQKSAGMGSYLTLVSRIVNDVVYSRDGWDQFVDQWASIDLRISFPAWGLKGVLWVLRKILGGTLQGMGMLHLSLSRQLEYNADNVAVSVSGSDAIVHALSRLDFAAESLGDAAKSLDAAADHGHFSDDLFYHQTQAAQRLRSLRKSPALGLPPALPANHSDVVQVFQEEHDGIPDYLRSHPTNMMREKNAKRIYVRSIEDDRSPWILFDDRTAISRAVTEVFYFQQLGRKEAYHPEPAEQVQQFLNAEHAETTYDPRYHGYYDSRFVQPGDLTAEPDAQWNQEKVETVRTRWLGDAQAERMKKFQERQGEMELLQGLESGQLTLKKQTFLFREQDRTKKDVSGLVKLVDSELEEDIKYFQQLDHDIYQMHRYLADQLDQTQPVANSRTSELQERYQFHVVIQGLLKGMLQEEAHFVHIMRYLETHQQIDAESGQQFVNSLNSIHKTIKVNLDDANNHRMPQLTNVPAGTSLKELITDRSQARLEDLTLANFSGEWLGRLANRLASMVSRVRRVHFKSMGGLLQFQERLQAESNTHTASEVESKEQ